jgi:hypothetical protein
MRALPISRAKIVPGMFRIMARRPAKRRCHPVRVDIH